MAKFRLVHTSFWNDPRVVEEMTAEDKYFFLYLLTNESTTQIGIYQITKKQIAFDLGYSPESANALLQRFIDHHKLVKYNTETREIAIKNWGKYNLVRGGKPILDCVKSELKNVKDATLIEWVGENIPNDSIRYVYESYYVTCNDTSTLRDDSESKEPQVNGGATSHVTSTTRGQEEDKEEEEEEDKEEEEEDKEEEDKEEEEEKDKEREEKKTPPPSSPLIDNDFLKLKNHFETKVIYQEAVFVQLTAISNFIEDYHDTDLILKAMDISVERGKPHLPYINGILKAWRLDGITNINQLNAKEASQHGNTGPTNGTHHGRTPEEIAMLERLRTYSSNPAK